MSYGRSRWLAFAGVFCLAATALLVAADEPNLTEEQKIEFLLHAKVINSRHENKGVTGTAWRLTLSDGKLTHDASFQTVDISKSIETLSSGRTEINFKDSYKFNMAGYQLAKLLGLDDMVPVYVERKWNGDTGSISWREPAKMDEADRKKQGLHAPDTDAWNKQMYKVRVLSQLTYDTDVNMTNVLITEDWKIWRIDFTRAFREFKDLMDAKDLVMCDRNLLAKLKQLNYDELLEKTKGYLNKSQVKAVIARRDKIVAIFEKLVAEKGEAQVLY